MVFVNSMSDLFHKEVPVYLQPSPFYKVNLMIPRQL